MDVNRAGVSGEIVAPYVLQQAVPSQYDATIADHIDEQVEEAGWQVYLAVTTPYLATADINSQFVNNQDAILDGGIRRAMRGVGCWGLVTAPKEGTNPRTQFFPTEWFGDVVIRAQFQSDNFVRLFATRGQHQDGYMGCFGLIAELPTDIQPIETRQHEVEQNERHGIVPCYL